MIGKHGLMSTSFEKTEYKSSGNGCEEGERKYAYKYVYDIVGEPEVDGDIAYYNARPSAIYVAAWDHKFNEQQITCTDTPLNDGEFYDVTQCLTDICHFQCCY